MEIFVLLLLLIYSEATYDINISPICSLHSYHHNGRDNPPRIIAIADIHGSFESFKSILVHSKISNEKCEWLPQQENGVILVQVGDIVDRGAQSIEAWRCLDKLQDEAISPNKVVRLIGNHEIWWLQGRFHDRNKAADTKEKVLFIVEALKSRIMNETIQGAYLSQIHPTPLLFIHAGLRTKMINYMVDTMKIDLSPLGIVSSVNSVTKNEIEYCAPAGPCGFKHELFQAGSERGGNSIGGPFWTDYSILENTKAKDLPIKNLLQV